MNECFRNIYIFSGTFVTHPRGHLSTWGDRIAELLRTPNSDILNEEKNT